MAPSGWPTSLKETDSRGRSHRALFGTLASATLIGIGDVLIDDNSILLGLLAVVPFVTAATAGPRATVIVGAYAVVLAVLLGTPNNIWGTLEHLARVSIVTGAAAIGVGVAAGRERRDRAIRDREASFREFFRAAPVAMAAVLAENDKVRVIGGNLELNRLFDGFDDIERSFNESLDGYDRSRLVALVRAVAEGRPEQSLTLGLTSEHGRRWVSVRAAVMTEAEPSGLVLLHLQDVTGRVRAEEQLRQRALHDMLTGLASRELLLDRLEQMLASDFRNQTVTAVLFVDLDRFKTINDRYGHAAGDRVLVESAVRIRHLLRPGDTASRFGGDEFVVACGGLHQVEEGQEIADRILQAFATPVEVNDRSVHLSASIGIAFSGSASADVEQLVADADFAMYQAKQAGRHRIALFDETARRRAVHRTDLEQALRRALVERQFVLHYQPLVNLDTGRVAGVEALLRWEHPERGLLFPDTFIEVAEETGLIVPIGSWAVREACQQWSSWQVAGNPVIDVAVNLSPMQLGQDAFPDTVSDALAVSGADPAHLLFEITESTFLDASSGVTAELDRLTELGARLGVDDFGTGYSSLLSLKRFPVSHLKVDRGFVAGLGRRAEDRVIVAAIIRLGQELGLTTVAEGVETWDQLRAMRQLGCTLAQGYLLARAQPAAMIPGLLRQRWQVTVP